MECIILGSGGCVSIPRPLCFCPVCAQARERGAPYARCGCSLYAVEPRLLIDTPEDIVHALNAQAVGAVDAVAYSHWDPDHTLGMRVFEQLRLDWLAHSEGIFRPDPVRVLALDGAMDDLSAIANRFGGFLAYYEKMGLIRRETVKDSVSFGGVRLSLVPVDETRRVAVFVFEEAGKRLVYAPCDVKPFPKSPLFAGADVLILGNTMIGPPLKGGFIPSENNPLRRELFTLEEALILRQSLGVPRLILTHLEEDWGKSFDDYRALEARLPGVSFAYDGMRISL